MIGGGNERKRNQSLFSSFLFFSERTQIFTLTHAHSLFSLYPSLIFFPFLFFTLPQLLKNMHFCIILKTLVGGSPSVWDGLVESARVNLGGVGVA